MKQFAGYLSESHKPGIVILNGTSQIFELEKPMYEKEAAKKNLYIVVHTHPASEQQPQGWFHLILSEKPDLTEKEKEAIRLGGWGPIGEDDGT